MVKEERLEKHGTHDKYVIRTYDTSTPWIQTKRKDMVYVLQSEGWQIQYESRANPPARNYNLINLIL